MSGTEGKGLLKEVSEDYSRYLESGGALTSSQCRVIEDGMEDLEHQVSEFEQLIDLMESESSLYLGPDFGNLRAKYKETEMVFRRIDRLEWMVSIVREDLHRIDKQLAQAETTATEGAGGALRSLVPSFISSKFSSQEASKREIPDQEPPEFFSAKGFFKD